MSEPKIITDFRPPKGFGTGLESRDYSVFPQGFAAGPFRLPLIDRSEIPDRIREKEKARAGLKFIREICGPGGGLMPATNQGRTKYCWMYAVVTAVLFQRGYQGQPYESLSGTGPAAKVKNYRNQGGWVGEGIEYIVEHGIPREADIPQGMDGLRKDLVEMPEVWERAKQFRVVEWMELERGNLDQFATCLLLDIPVACEYMSMGHAMCAYSLTKWDGRNFEHDVLNSWGPNWGTKGAGRMAGRSGIPSGMVAPLAVEVG